MEKKGEIRNDFYTEFSSGNYVFLGDLDKNITEEEYRKDLKECEDQTDCFFDDEEAVVQAVMEYLKNK